jgi:hypothetical protein
VHVRESYANVGKRPIPAFAGLHTVEPMTLYRRFCFLVVSLTAATAFAAPPQAEASEFDSQTLERARVIRAEVDARYRRFPGATLRVTEASPTGVVDSLSLITDPLELPRVVSARNGIYFAICTTRGRCPYPRRSASLAATSFLPRRLALELALRTFRETSSTLVVVALPTPTPVWVVFERTDLEATVEAPTPLDGLASHPAIVDTPLRDFVDRLTHPRLFVPLPILPPTHETIYAASLGILEP